MSEWYDDIIVECQNPGCVGDGTAVWTGGSQKHGNDPPTQCRDCYEANNAQQEETIICSNCGEEYPYKPGHIIYHRRKIGPWELPDECLYCIKFSDDFPLKILPCQNAACQETFTYSPRWQKRIHDKGQNDPVLCEACRERNKTQQPVRIVCEVCGVKARFSNRYIISWRRNEGWWDDRPSLCKLCYEDPERAKETLALKELHDARKKLREKQQREPQDTVGYYLLKDGGGQYTDIVDATTYVVESNVKSYDVPDDVEWYANHEDTRHGITLLEHIMEGSSGSGHGWEEALGTTDQQAAISMAAEVAVKVDQDVIECTEGRFTIKYDTSIGIVAFIVNNEYAPPPERLNSGYPMGQRQVANNIIGAGKRKWHLS